MITRQKTKRKIGKSYSSVTGIYPSKKSIGPAKFESTLERDFIAIVDFKREVRSFQVQPFQIDFFDEKNQSRSYTPDILVNYDKTRYQKARTIVYEVKYHKDLRNKIKELRPKFKAAITLANSENWYFRIVTENEIRGPYLNNVNFLNSYGRVPLIDERFISIMSFMEDMREADPDTIIGAMATDPDSRAEVTWLIWQLVAYRYLITDLNKPLTQKTRLWLPYIENL